MKKKTSKLSLFDYLYALASNMEWTQYVDDDVVAEEEAVTLALADDDIDEIGDGINETEFADEEMIDVDPDFEKNDDELWMSSEVKSWNFSIKKKSQMKLKLH